MSPSILTQLKTPRSPKPKGCSLFVKPQSPFGQTRVYPSELRPWKEQTPKQDWIFFFFKQGCVVLKLLFLRTWGLSSHIMLSLQNKHSANICKSNIPTCLHYIFLWESHLCGYIFMTIYLLFTIIWTANHTGLPLWKFINKKHKDTSSTSNWWHDWLSPNTNLLLFQYLPLPHSHSEAN